MFENSLITICKHLLYLHNNLMSTFNFI